MRENLTLLHANSKDADQPAQVSLISTFVVCLMKEQCLNLLYAKFQCSGRSCSSADCEFYLIVNPKDRVSRVVDQKHTYQTLECSTSVKKIKKKWGMSCNSLWIPAFVVKVIFTFCAINTFLSNSGTPIYNVNLTKRGNFLTSNLYHKRRNT